MRVVHPRQRAESDVCGQRCIWPTRRFTGPPVSAVIVSPEMLIHRHVLGLAAGPLCHRRRAHAANGQVVPGVDPGRIGDGERDRGHRSRYRGPRWRSASWGQRSPPSSWSGSRATYERGVEDARPGESAGQSKAWKSLSVHFGIACGLPMTPGGRLTLTSLGWPTVLPSESVLNVNVVDRSACAPACVVEELVRERLDPERRGRGRARGRDHESGEQRAEAEQPWSLWSGNAWLS